jgi:TPP-dependent pyruvate/acetoin dehydrogenase alpha subunit
MKRYLKTKKLVSDQTIGKMEKEIQKEIQDAFRFAKESPFPKEHLSEEMVYEK